MGDAEQVVQGITPNPAVEYTGLWLNEKGLERALATRRLKVEGRIALCASEKFLKRNNNKSFAEHREL
jgi:hydroxymethylglutaryl-CoA lyase